MGIQDDLREQLIKQFPVEVIELIDSLKNKYYACKTCKRPVVKSDVKCPNCQQALNWSEINKIELGINGKRQAVVKFDVPGDFSAGDCRKCPLSYISKTNTSEIIYECPLKMRMDCKLEFKGI